MLIGMPPVVEPSLDEVVLDERGTFKYVQVKADLGDKQTQRILVRGYNHCEFHADVLERAETELKKIAPQAELLPLGGGRIRISKEDKTIFIYGYSQAFGRPDHSLTADMRRKH